MDSYELPLSSHDETCETDERHQTSAPICSPRKTKKFYFPLLMISLITGTLITIHFTPPLSLHDGRRLETIDDNGDVPSAAPETTSDVLRGCLLGILAIGVLVKMFFLASIVKHRTSPSVKIAQPLGQSFLVMGGAMALAGGCLLAAPPSDPTCALVEPFIFFSITLIWASITGMAWRVESLVAPVSIIGASSRSLRASTRTRASTSQLQTKQRLLDFFHFFHQWAKANLMAALTKLTQVSCWRTSTSRRKQRTNPTGIRRKVTSMSMVRVVIFFTFPQTVLQVINISLHTLRSFSAPAPAEQCSRPSGALWALWFGALLTAFPFASALLLTSSPVNNDMIVIPPILSEAESVKKIAFSFAVVAAIAGPMVGLTSDSSSPNAKMYSSVCLLLGAAVPPICFIVWKKLRPVWFEETFSIADKISPSKQKTSLKTRSSLRDSRQDTGLDQTRNVLKDEALKQGKVFQDMGMIDFAVKIYNDALKEWCFDRNDDGRERIGGYTVNEVQSFSQSDVCSIAKLLIAKGECYTNSNPDKAVTSYVRALEIFELAPCTEHLRERYIIFPCFHALFQFIREGKMERNASFEKDLSLRFVTESKGYFDKSHYACALAVRAELKAHSGSVHRALDDFEEMVGIYQPRKHSSTIKEASGLDVCALVHSRSAIWYLQSGEEEKAINMCEVVIKMLPELLYILDTECIPTLHAVLIPIIRILKYRKQGERMRELYEKYFGEDASNLKGMQIYSIGRNMSLVLKLSDGTGRYGGMDDDITWVLSGSNAELPQELDYFYISLGWSMNTLAAEACFCLARRCDSSQKNLIRLLGEKGLSLLNSVDFILKQHEMILWPIANDANERVMRQMQTLTSWRRLQFAQSKPTPVNINSGRCARAKSVLRLRAKKTLPHKLLLSHNSVAFVGLTNDSLPKVFQKAISEEQNYKWKSIHIFYISDSLIEWFSKDNTSELIKQKYDSRIKIASLLSDRVEELHFYEIQQHCFFGSFFDWRTPGGYIHVSPSIWGVDPKNCPAQDYTWNLGDNEPDHVYKSYSDGLENLLSTPSHFAEPVERSSFVDNDSLEVTTLL